MKQILSALILVLASTAFAGHEVGNGGGVIVCLNPPSVPPAGQPKPAPPASRVELLDLFEAREFRKLPLGLGDPNEDYKIKINRVLTQLERIAPYRTQLYRTIYNRFEEESVFVANIDLVYIPDSEYKGLPTNCFLKQAIIQQPPEFLGDKRYTISLDLWNQLDNNSKAALVLHEVIYNEGIAIDQTTSKAVRYLVSYLTSTTLSTLTQDNLNRMLQSAGFRMIDAFGTFVFVATPTHFVSANYEGTDSDAWNIYRIQHESAGEFYNQIKLTGSFKLNGMTIRTNQFVVTGSPGSIYATRGVLQYTSADASASIKSTGGLFAVYFENSKAVGFSALKAEGDGNSLTFNLNLNGFKSEISFDADSIYAPNVAYLILNNNLSLEFGNLSSKNAFSGKLKIVSEGASQYGVEFHSIGVIADNGVVLSGFLSGRTVLKTSQGPLSFERSAPSIAPAASPAIDSAATPIEQNMPTLFSENGSVQTGYLSPNQTVRTAKGPYSSKAVSHVRFLPNGLVEVLNQ